MGPTMNSIQLVGTVPKMEVPPDGACGRHTVWRDHTFKVRMKHDWRSRGVGIAGIEENVTNSGKYQRK
ncbi:hypothetical protein T265_07281 [Opisthorchis viverrini]|uniref:Uncharacterized protein n=1 Tax=Opisthorchis viverrini TaxID=6198 RepID=A0A074ZD85_OPIVI|nr:hypothetical protein T265_07281 [Opisthorchis viverrini]KER25246.1 hypothetical protein T265_07281 [Opisthorchis viverrini]